MKKCLIILWVLLVAVATQAQVSMGLVAGFNMCDEITFFNGTADARSTDMPSLKGLVIGPTIEMMIKDYDIGIELSTLYSRKGSNFSYYLNNPNATPSYAVQLEGYKNIDYMEVPLYIKWRFGPRDFKMFIAGGYYWGFGLSGTVEVEKAEDLYFSNQPIPELLKSTKMKFGEEKYEPYNLIDRGYTFGAGINIVNTLEIAIYYSYGTKSVVNDRSMKDLLPEDPYGYDATHYDISSHNNVVSVRLTYLFSSQRY